MLTQPGIEPQNLSKKKKIRPTLYQLSYHVYLHYLAKKLKVNQLELFENYFKMPSSNEIDNCAMAYLGHIMNSKSLYYHFPMLKNVVDDGSYCCPRCGLPDLRMACDIFPRSSSFFYIMILNALMMMILMIPRCASQQPASNSAVLS